MKQEAKINRAEKNRISFPVKSYQFFSWPFISFLVLVSFSIVFMTVLPWFNTVGYAAFWDTGSSALSFNYFLIPFIALDVCVLLGYFKAVRRLAPALDRKIAKGWDKIAGALSLRKEARKAARQEKKLKRKAAKAA